MGWPAPRVFWGVKDAPQLTYWSGSADGPTDLSILRARRTNGATTAHECHRWKITGRWLPVVLDPIPPTPPTHIHTPSFCTGDDQVVVFSSFCSLPYGALSSLCDVSVCLWAGQLEYIHLSAPFVVVKNKEVNLTAVLLPSQVGTVTYIWWIGNNTEVVCTLSSLYFSAHLTRLQTLLLLDVLFSCIKVEIVQTSLSISKKLQMSELQNSIIADTW